MLMLGLNGTVDQLAMANSVHWYGHVMWKEGGHVMWKEGGHVLRMALSLEVEDQRMKEIEVEEDKEEVD